MIHEDDDEPSIIDFSWFYFIGKTKLGLSFKEVGRMTYFFFNKLYTHYKDTWSLEMRLWQANMTYSDLFARMQKEDEWF